MNDIYKNTNITNLGVLDFEGKQKNWKDTKGLSGSQMVNLLSYPEELYAVKRGHKEVVFTKKAQEKMQAGTELEAYIRNKFIEKGYESTDDNLALGSVVPETFARKYNGYKFIANIDGWKLECKNSEKSIEALVDFYYPQIQYYMWFFDVDEWYLATFENGWKLRERLIKRDEHFIEEMLAKAILFLGKLNQEAELEEPFPWGVSYSTSIKTTYLETDLSMEDFNLIDEITNIKLKIDFYNAKLEELKGNVLTKFNTGASIKGSKATISTSHVERKGNIDYKAIVNDLLSLSDEELNRYRGDTSSYDQVTVKIKKGVTLELEEDLEEFSEAYLFE